jgi:predicted tellurium resistance membrane protein TerC
MVGMTNGVEGALYIMITVISVLIMMQFAVPVGSFVNKHPSIQILGLSFLIFIGFYVAYRKCSLIKCNFWKPCNLVPKGYLYL